MAMKSFAIALVLVAFAVDAKRMVEDETGSLEAKDSISKYSTQKSKRMKIQTMLNMFNELKKTEFSKIGEKWCDEKVQSVDTTKLPEISGILSKVALSAISAEKENKCAHVLFSFLELAGNIREHHAKLQSFQNAGLQDDALGPQIENAHEGAKLMRDKLFTIVDSAVASGEWDDKSLLDGVKQLASVLPVTKLPSSNLELPQNSHTRSPDFWKKVNSALVEVNQEKMMTTTEPPPTIQPKDKEEEILEAVKEVQKDVVEEVQKDVVEEVQKDVAEVTARGVVPMLSSAAALAGVVILLSYLLPGAQASMSPGCQVFTTRPDQYPYPYQTIKQMVCNGLVTKTWNA